MNDDVRKSLRDYTRAIGGGLVIGLPLLYTMEVWFHGSSLPSWKVLLLLASAAVIVVGYNSSAGFRRERTWTELLADSLVTVGLGVVLAFVALVILGRIQAGDSLRDAAGMVALESIPIAFGASVAATQLGGEQTGKGHSVGPFQRLFVGAGGALLFALNVAPTEEPLMLGIAAPPWLLLTVIAATLVLTLALVFFADFGGRRAKRGASVLEHPLTETLTSYALSLGVAFFLLWAFGRTEGASIQTISGMTVMLAAIASVGAAVARLLVGGEHEAGGE